ncbi:MAG: iron-containing alcohol dehydrogenase [Desulfofustis sp.]|nr:iron-containing alcohol dehydrogenase [Desulfofustis sp.]
MENFVYHHPVKIIFGRQALDQLNKELTALGRRVLLVYGQNSAVRSGLHGRITDLLNGSGIELIEFAGVRPNPLHSTVQQGILRAREAHCETIVAVGGGSVIDTAKAISAGVLVAHDVWRFFNGKKSVRQSLPLITIPTAAGSGSETNHGMVITHDEHGLKFGFAHRHLYPRVCLADPSLTCTVTTDQTIYGCVDALCHCLEPYLTTKAAGIEFQRRFLESTAQTLIEATRGCLENPGSFTLRSALLWSSMMAMSPISTAGLGRVYHSLHVLEHGLSALHEIPHGAGLAALLTSWLTCHLEQFRVPISRWGEKVFDLGGAEKPSATIDAVRGLLESLGVPLSLGDLGLTEQDLGAVASHAAAQLEVRRIPGLDEARALEILKRAL